ncbi:MAG: hypothetical protein M1438_11395 [Deltaproteobacteria bacterium]|nr:hypothetical protein [Deltaproteobacteria bacterium]
MPEQRNFLEYHKSIASELNATKDRIRRLIGNQHWLTDGEHKEAVLRKVLRTHLPESVRVGRGFVCFKNESSNQIDILVTSYDRPTLFKDGELVLVTPDAVQAIIEIKTALRSGPDIENVIKKLSKNVKEIRSNGNKNCQAGLFVYEEPENRNRIEDSLVLRALQSAANGQEGKVVNWIAFGPDRFFRFWSNGRWDVRSPYDGPVWHSYELNEGLAHAYFVSNVVWDVSRQNTLDMQYAWFPVEGGKERFRRWYIPLSNGQAMQFNQ